uniref:Uncharacterized protein n=1 Tax=Rhinolophus ferrumequinum TaxID=59479 RepID=A0A671E5H9_RHIFE
MVPTTSLLTVQGSEGLYLLSGPPHFTESTVFPRELRMGPCLPGATEKKINIINHSWTYISTSGIWNSEGTNGRVGL